MKGYSTDIPENCASARVEGVNASYKDLVQVCGSIRSRKSDWAVAFLEKAADGKVAILYRKHNKRLGHRKELGGRKGRYPKKAAKVVLKVLQSAIANGKLKGLGDVFTIRVATANSKHSYPRIAAKGRWSRSSLGTSRVEIILQGSEIPKGVEFTPPKKPEEKPEAKKEKPAAKEEAPKKEKPKEKAEEKKEEKKEERPPPKILKKEAQRSSTRKKEKEKELEHAKEAKDKPHHHGEYSKR